MTLPYENTTSAQLQATKKAAAITRMRQRRPKYPLTSVLR